MSRSRWLWLPITLLLGAAWAPGAARAVEREYVLRWLPSAGPVEGYRVYLDAAGRATQALDLGVVGPDADGIARSALQLDAATTYSVAMTAYNSAGESARSNRIEVPASACDPAACSDGDPCTADDCGDLSCTHARLPDGSICGSGRICSSGACMVPECTRDADCADTDLCNGTESCANYRCAAGSALSCPLAGPCQQAGCSAQSGCWLESRADGSPCDDGSPDTTGDVCVAGHCTGTVFSGCRSDADCADGDACNGVEICASDGTCLAGADLVCGLAGPCQQALCAADRGCVTTPRADGTPCDDGLASTSGDQCVAGQCTGKAAAGLSLISITPGSLFEARYYWLKLKGTGFAKGLVPSFRSASMLSAPRVFRTRVLDAGRAEVLVWTRRRSAAEVWDVVVTLPDGRIAVLRGALRTEP